MRKTLVDKSKLDQHLMNNSGENPYHCSYCDSTLLAKINLDQHMLVHTGEKPYKCTYCDEALIIPH